MIKMFTDGFTAALYREMARLQGQATFENAHLTFYEMHPPGER